MGQTCIGGGANSGFRIAPEWQIQIDVSGCDIIGLGNSHLSGDSLSYGIGPCRIPTAAKRWSPYGEFSGRRQQDHTRIGVPRKEGAFESSPKNLDAEDRVERLIEIRHPGQKPTVITPALEAKVLAATQRKPKDGSTHWSCRKLGNQLGISKDTVHRIWRKAG
jgi:hypothetical protein